MRTLQPLQTGLVFGLVIAFWHVAWLAMVLVGWAQPVMDFVFRIHLIRPVFVVEAFDPGRAALLVAVTFFVSFVMAWIFAVTWNWLVRPRVEP